PRPQTVSDRADRLRARLRIHAAGIRGDLDVLFGEDGEEPLHQWNEVLGIAQRRVAGFLFLQDRHRDFGQVVHHQVIDRPARYLAVGSLEPVTPEPLPARDPYGLFAARPRRGGRGGGGGGHLGGGEGGGGGGDPRGGRAAARAARPPPRALCRRSSTSGANPAGNATSSGA